MSDYTIVKLGDVENVAPRFQMPEGMDVRFPKRHLGCSVGGVGIEKLPAGVRQPFGHKHSEQEEIYVIAEGSGRIKLDDEIHELEQWDILRIGPGVMRNLEAGSDGITLIAFGAPSGEQNDGEIVPGWWVQPNVQVSAGESVSSPFPCPRSAGAPSHPGSATVTWSSGRCPVLVTRIVNRTVAPTCANRGAVFAISIDGGQVTVSVTDASSSPWAPAGSFAASTEAVFVTSPHRTASPIRAVNEVDTLSPDARDERRHVTDQCSGPGGATEPAMVQ